MFVIIPIIFVAVFNMFCGIVIGHILSEHKNKRRHEFDEKSVYCHGFEDGIYYTLDEYNPDLFRIEIAENCYKEYKAIKQGPEEH